MGNEQYPHTGVNGMTTDQLAAITHASSPSAGNPFATIADTGGGTAIQSAVLEADFPKDDDTLTAVPDLTLNLEAGHRYRITGQFMAVEAGGGGGALIDLAGGTVVAAGVGGVSNRKDDGGSNIVGITGLNDFLCGEDGGTARAMIDLVIDVDTSGTLIPRFAQLSTNIAASVLRKYSAIYATDITPG